MSFRGLGIEDSERIEAQSGLVELLGELGLPCSCRIERLVLDAVKAHRDLPPPPVDGHPPSRPGRAVREAEPEVTVRAWRGPDPPRPGGRPPHASPLQQ